MFKNRLLSAVLIVLLTPVPQAFSANSDIEASSVELQDAPEASTRNKWCGNNRLEYIILFTSCLLLGGSLYGMYADFSGANDARSRVPSSTPTSSYAPLMTSSIAPSYAACVEDALQSSESESYSLKDKIDLLNHEISSLSEDKSCSSNGSCSSIGIGAKACGGFQSALVYSTENLPVDCLKSKAEQLYTLEEQYNRENQIVSNCEHIDGDIPVSCEEGICVEI